MLEIAPDQIATGQRVKVERNLFLLPPDHSPSPHKPAARDSYEKGLTHAKRLFAATIIGTVVEVPKPVPSPANPGLISSLHVQPDGERPVTWVLPADKERTTQYEFGNKSFLYGVSQQFFVES